MKIKIESNGENITLQFAATTGSKAVSKTFTKQELTAVIELLQTAIKVDMFRMEYEVRK